MLYRGRARRSCCPVQAVLASVCAGGLTGPATTPLVPQVSFMSMAAAKAGGKEIDAAELSAHLALRYAGQVLTIGQQFVFEFQVRSLISALHPAAWLVVFPRCTSAARLACPVAMH